MRSSVMYQGVLAVILLLFGSVFAGGISDQECSNYRELKGADRLVSYKAKKTLCDRGLGSDVYPGEWHRFVGDAGQMMPEVCVTSERCGAKYSGWLDGTHPSVEDGIVQRKVCFRHSWGGCCRLSTNILVKNCSTFYVYKFSKPPYCPLRYCGIEGPSDFCSFDKGLCGYMNRQPSRGTDWKLKRNVQKLQVKDHTSGNGSFVYASLGWSLGHTLPIAQLISPPMWNIGCVQFYYYRQFFSDGRLDVLIEVNGRSTLVWTVERTDESSWKFASIPIVSPINRPIKIIFQSELVSLIDDVKVMSDGRSCKLVPSQPEDKIFREGQGNCNFDTSMCGYSTKDNWKRLRGTSFSSRYRRVTHDHTFSNGMYIYAARSRSRRWGRRSQLVSPILTNVQCVTFYYYMHGKHAGELNVYTRVQNINTRVLKFSGNYGEQWRKAVVYLDKIPTKAPFRLIFESVRTSGIAIDDISTSSKCRPTTTLQPTGNERKVRLAGGDGYSLNKGRVEVLHNGRWGTICDKSWSIEDATVVCKMLGFSGAKEATRSARFGSGSGDIWLTNVQCTGNEKSISECKHADWGANNCLHSQDAGVICDEGDFHATEYTTVVPQNGSCYFENSLCGYTNQDKRQKDVVWARRNESYSDGTRYGHMEVVTNSSTKPGSEATFTSPILSSSSKCLRINYLLSLSPPHHNFFDSDIGTLNVYIKSLGSNILKKIWTLSGPQYVEYQVGQVHLVQANDTEQFQVVFEYISGQYTNRDVQIDNIETFNSSCEILPFKAMPDVNDVRLRLNGGKSNMEGRVEVYAYGDWGTVSEDGWSLRLGRVACRHLKFSGAVGVYRGSAFGKAMVSGPMWSAYSHIYPMCKANETNLGRCLGSRSVPRDKWRDAGVECFDVRLADGKSPSEGRVEINYKGKWGTVCKRGWDINSANVICRDLGYHRAKALSSFGQGKGEMRLSDVKCRGDEESIAFCSYRGWNVKDCDHSQDVGVVCTNDKQK